ncbi:PAS domain-containing sensor histidine kinase [Methylobacterium sp. Leaf117]|uniref:hybrid sensor histidine kinase/response regulator n=1 Tax=Methylobacterium sp. Leaf117 TaxID=1736260 RepID=UPI0006F3DBF8|nr:histidine kinase [Methylobacterium sp. Leaf117]
MSDATAFLAGGGEAARLIRARDWSAHSLGQPETWPQAFKTALSLVLNSPESMILAWGPGLHFFFNDTYSRLLGPRVAWAMGERFDRVWADAWEQAKPIIEDAFAGRSRRFEDLPWTLDTDRGAAQTWFSFSYSRVLDADGRIAGLFIFTNETTQRVLADAALKDSQEKLERALGEVRSLNTTLERRVEERTNERDLMWDTAPDLMLIIDFAGVFRRVNPAWTRLLGYEPHELVGHHVNEFVLAEDHVETVDAYTEASEGGMPHIVNRYRHKDGSTRWISWTAAPAGTLTYATGRDITEARERQAELEQAQEALRQSQKLEAVGQLTGGVAHDFNNLLTIIRSSVDFLRRPDLPEARKDRYLNAVSDTVERAAKLTGQLLAFARRQALKPEVFDVGERMRGIAEMLDTVTGARVRVVAEVPDAPCFVRADLSQFETALINMSVNARDAMDGGGTLTLRLGCRTTLPVIRGHAGSRKAFAAVSLVDTGSGIPPDLLSRIFEPFFTTKEVGKGTGLGLSQVFGFAKQSGGDIDVASTIGQGTTFTLYLPEVEQAEVEARVRGPEGGLTPLGTGQRILVVEDNIGVGQFATQILEDLGYRPTWAANAEEALDLLGGDGAGFDLVFTDVVMPGMGGVELAKGLQRRLPDLPVVLASGYSHVLAQEGTHGFELLQKPYSAVQLGDILHRLLGLHARGSI